MKLYLHCGYHKTGSSFLQTLFSLNRDLLVQNRIHYPHSELEYEALHGMISPGNGDGLSRSLVSGDVKDVTAIIQEGVDAARKSQCDSLLYSAEAFFHAFPKKDVLRKLTEAAGNAGVENIFALIYFRDPVSHALSTYKHRAKNGNYIDFEEWVREKYETMDLLKEFCNYQSEYSIEWTCRKYRPGSEFMAESAFCDWLKTALPEIPENDRVNSSLTLSEIRVIQSVKNTLPELIPHLYDAFQSVHPDKKSKDKSLDQYFQKIAARELHSQEIYIQSVNKHLPDGEKLQIIPQVDDIDMKWEEPEISITIKQSESMARAVQNMIESASTIMRARNLWSRGTRKLQRILKAKGY